MKLIGLLSTVIVASGFELTVLHTNDVSARFEQFNKYGSKCSENEAALGKCFGGVARRQSKIHEIRGSHDNVLLLDAGDQLIGTAWTIVYRGMATSFFMNQLGYDAMCLGNHEFDIGIDGLKKFLENVTFSVVSANTDVMHEPRLQGKFRKSSILNVDGEQIGIVGYVTPETAEISNPGPSFRFKEIISSVQYEVSVLQSKGVNKIIALGNAGFDIDRKVATIDGIDVVFGGHSNIFLNNGDQPSGEKIDGPYPFIVEEIGGNKGLVVQANTHGKYLGYLNIIFDSVGTVTNYSGNPILLDSSVQEDEEILRYMRDWKLQVDGLGTKTVGYSKVDLDGERSHCRLRECNLGNLITDAIIDYHVNYSHPENQWTPAAIAIWNGGNIRTSIDKGPVIARNIMDVMPFGNIVDMVTISGQNLRDQLEISVQDINENNPHGRFLQMSGMRVVYNLHKPVGQRVSSVEVRCLECDIPTYIPLNESDIYNIFASTFLLDGGDGYKFSPIRRQLYNNLDVSIVMEYFKRHNPVYAQKREGFISTWTQFPQDQ
ncbi:snake venom 5'-nucleotidase-like [Mercenaria mercenaria]|uniref:snake venom 5'-nucleotidase-like n=1 Tax=Mercenaria mercenaria TaxID=6596 RepID=UPI00234F827D|nr:snake venom 5'-nucleotidase-like [Mercenaria mercenaria]